ncbi:hypothetical protein HPB51_014016 [Rhipicephalus microplus]|uniref:Ig-like domain-containing protein n=1 Tax=Rhipicephalus microplus TaxID=6941 RepID=A0A9J6DAS6_RHIMP|nr:hypothetical protein HPB51_014016 [Rhipicephalus microplus]
MNGALHGRDGVPFPLQLSTSRASRAAGPLSRVEPIPVAPEPKFDILEPKYDAPLLSSRPIRAPPPPLVHPEQSRPSLFEPLSVRTSFCLETGQFQSPRSIIRTKTASPVWSPKKKAVVIAENPATASRRSQGPEDVFAVPGQPATLRALLTGCPAPRLRWFKDGLPVHGPDHVVGQPSGPAPWTAWLSIPEAFPEDSGVYVCTASNLVGNTSACCRLTVFGQLLSRADYSGRVATGCSPIRGPTKKGFDGHATVNVVGTTRRDDTVAG